jgi:hypothetical protein
MLWTFLMRLVHVAESKAIARAEAEQALLVLRSLGRDGIAKTPLGFKGHSDSSTKRDLAPVSRG